ncbi:MAG: peptidase M14 [Bernardetiaceae bacterium]|nr:peptidase M14 [Bernardetiaceae bacterium]
MNHQEDRVSLHAKNNVASLLSHYESFTCDTLRHRHFSHADLISVIDSYEAAGEQLDWLEVHNLGASFEGRVIKHITIGRGDIPILLWSQMHGNEATATMALMDIIQFFLRTQSGESEQGLITLSNHLLQNCKLHIVPMLNPDGAERFIRHTAMGIDMNRDFLARTTPEANLLIDLAADIQPYFAFNLHDQVSKYSVGKTPVPTAISFLAPAYNEEKEINDTRKEAMQLIATMSDALKPYIDERLAKYNDTFGARCFGDNFQKLGYRTILIESGYYPQDPEKQQIRKYNFIAIIAALEAVTNESYKKQSLEKYENLPFNGELFYDLILRNLRLEKQGKSFVTDIAIEQHSCWNSEKNSYQYKAKIAEIGDLDSFHGHEDHDCSGLHAELVCGSFELEDSPTFYIKKKDSMCYIFENGFLSSGSDKW